MLDIKVLVAGFAATALFGVAGCATANEGTDVAAAEGSDTDVICRRVHEVGSRLNSRRCQTRAEWDAEREAAQEALERTGNSRSVDPFLPGGPG